MGITELVSGVSRSHISMTAFLTTKLYLFYIMSIANDIIVPLYFP